MLELITFILATCGLTFITNKSKLFAQIRIYISDRYSKTHNKKLLYKKQSKMIFIWEWLENIFSCGMCMSIYTGTICVAVMLFLPAWVLYPFCATTAITIIFQYYDKQNKK
jgi:hypothetical protein